MNEQTLNMLDEAIRSEIEVINDMPSGTVEYITTIDGITKLMDKQLEAEKLKSEREKTSVAQENELKRMKSENVDKIAKNVIAGIGTIGGLTLTVWGTLKTLKFEETGTLTTTAGRNFIARLFPKK